MSKPTSTRLLTVAAISLLAVGSVITWVNLPESVDADGGKKEVEKAVLSRSSDPELAELSLSKERDNNEVFRRAFWRHPSALDKIIQAERREWSDDSGVQRWDWFIAVDASDAFTSYLLKKNPFQLKAIAEVQTFSGTPVWFPKASEGFEFHQTRDRGMTVLFNSKTRRLYAKSEGRGFKAGKAEEQTVTVPQHLQSIGRLPNAPPPSPKLPAE